MILWRKITYNDKANISNDMVLRYKLSDRVGLYFSESSYSFYIYYSSDNHLYCDGKLNGTIFNTIKII